MKKNLTIAAAGLFAMVALGSCSKKDTFVGSWQGLQPIDISSSLPAAASGNALLSVTFNADSAKTGTGTVEFTSLVSANQSVDETPGIVSPYEVSVAATAAINGTWSYAPGEDDELILNLDYSTLNVTVDPNGVTFRQNQLTEAQMPLTDSLTTATAELWKSQISDAMHKEFMKFSRIEDVKVKTDKSGTEYLKFETDHPDQEFMFRKAL